MKWFKHMSDMLDDLFVVQLMDHFGVSGYGVWCGLLEIYAKYCEDRPGEWIEIPWIIFRDKLRCKRFHFEKQLVFHKESGKIELEIKEKSYNIKIPKMLEFRDEWTSRKNKNSGVAQEKLPPKKKEERIQEEKTSKKEPQNSEFAEGARYLAKSNNPNLSNVGWVTQYLEKTFSEIRKEREIPLPQFLTVWRETCDDASAKAVGSPKWYRTAFEGRLRTQQHPASNQTEPEERPEVRKLRELLSFPLIRNRFDKSFVIRREQISYDPFIPDVADYQGYCISTSEFEGIMEESA